ncbi:lycopene cyclase domain-containing protein [Patescibacteria group bacterium]|nr:MAG: lycopene cyclase domain-containing protein [Patescibacteria group bacterium]
MANFIYLITLVVSLGGLFYLDYRYRLAFFTQPQLTTRVVAISVLFFLVWDVVGILVGIFSTNQRYVSGVSLAHPNLPLEELLFLTLLSYLTLLIWRWRTQ